MNTSQIKCHSSYFLIFCVGLIGMFPHSGYGSSAWEDCPRQFGEREVKLVGGPEDWIAYSPRRLPLDAAGFMAGAPATKTDLKPYSTEKHGRNLISTWKFDPDFISESDGLWLVCSYGEGGELTLSRRISSQFVDCSVTYAEKKANTDRVIRIACK